jgi:hypothetical protein
MPEGLAAWLLAVGETRAVVPSASGLERRVLLGSLDPIVRVGIERALTERGVAVLRAVAGGDALVAEAAANAPNAIVVGNQLAGLSGRLRRAAPGATVVVWRGHVEIIEVHEPGHDAPRIVPAPAAEGLCGELFGPRPSEGEACPTI